MKRETSAGGARGAPQREPDLHCSAPPPDACGAAETLLSHRSGDGRIITYPERGQTNPYQKWQGPHWTLVCLAEIGQRRGDRSLLPLRDQFYDWLFDSRHLCPPRSLLIPGQEERFRRCAGQEGYAAWYSLTLDIADDRTEELVDRRSNWQWPDGGWNCDKRPEAAISSFHETLIPLRALSLHARLTGSRRSRDAARRAAEVFLQRKMFRRKLDGTVMDPRFLLLQFPHFYSYDILFGLKVMTEAGFIGDPRCAEALDILASKRLPSGGWPLELKAWTEADRFTTRGTFVDWGPCGRARANPWVTRDALFVLEAAGRLGA
jgi:hypothetical protein